MTFIKNATTEYLNYPTGTVIPCATATIPEGWVLCDGGVYNGADSRYSALWTAIGTTYGGTNQASFRVPNLGGRVITGVKTVTPGPGIDGPVGSWGGSSATTLTAAQTGVRSHFHNVTDNGHSHTINHNYGGHTHTIKYWTYNYETKNADRDMYNADGGNPRVYSSTSATFSMSMNGVNNLTSLSVNNSSAVDASSSHDNTQPSMSLNYIIKL
jgi:microcystin-dependent protein